MPFGKQGAGHGHLGVLGGAKQGASIRLSASTFVESSAQNTAIGTLSVSGTTGTPTFTLVDSHTSATQLAVDGVSLQVGSASSGVGSFSITVGVSGVTPAISNTTFLISALPKAPTLVDLEATSDSGVSSTDNITNINTPTIDIVCGTTPVAGDTITVYKGGVFASSFILTAGMISGSSAAGLGLSALADGTYSITATHARSGLTSAASGALSLTIDTTAPVLSSPSGVQDGTTQTSADLSVTTNKGQGTIYWVVLAAAAGAPSAAQIIAGQDSTGTAVAAGQSGNLAVSSTGAKTATATGISSSGNYKAYFTQTDTAGNTASVSTSAQWTQTISGFTANGVSFNGATYLTNAATTGLVNGQKGIISLWVNSSATTGFIFLGKDTGTKFFLQILSAGIIAITGRNAAAASILSLKNGTAFSTTGWHHVAFSWDLSTGAGQCYVDGASNLSPTKTLTNDTIVYNNSTIYVGSNAGATFYTGGLAELYVNEHETIDFSVAANLQKFRDSGGNPVSLGSTGSTPTGTQPEIYLGGSHNFSTWGTNNGACGNFSVTAGSLSSLAGPP